MWVFFFHLTPSDDDYSQTKGKLESLQVLMCSGPPAHLLFAKFSNSFNSFQSKSAINLWIWLDRHQYAPSILVDINAIVTDSHIMVLLPSLLPSFTIRCTQTTMTVQPKCTHQPLFLGTPVRYTSCLLIHILNRKIHMATTQCTQACKHGQDQ